MKHVDDGCFLWKTEIKMPLEACYVRYNDFDLQNRVEKCHS